MAVEQADEVVKDESESALNNVFPDDYSYKTLMYLFMRKPMSEMEEDAASGAFSTMAQALDQVFANREGQEPKEGETVTVTLSTNEAALLTQLAAEGLRYVHSFGWTSEALSNAFDKEVSETQGVE